MNKSAKMAKRLNGWAGLVGLCLWAGLSAGAAQAQSIVQEFYIPLPEEQVRSSLIKLYTSTGPTFDSVISVVISSPGTKVVYDHWEDGYEIDLNSPAQASTRVWGDGNDANGIAPGYANDPAGLPAGAVFPLRNNVALPRSAATILYDGRDRVGASKAIVISRAAWALNPGSVLAGAVEVSSVLDYGTEFISPVGENISAASMFEVVDLFVMAAENGTVVSIDKDANGSFETTTTLNRGESYRVNGGVLKGARVTTSKPTQAHLITGDIGANYESRWLTLYPVEQWSPIYYSPVGTAADGDQAYAFLYNSGTNPLPIQVTTQTGSTNFNVASNGYYQYQMPKNSGAKFASTNGAPFFAVEVVGANPTANNVHDWGFTLVPEGNLTTIAVVGWGPGSSDLSQNGSPIWVTAVKDTTLYVDFDGDKAGALTDPNGDGYDTNLTIAALQSLTIYDPDKDQTAMRIYTLDGVLITAAYGQDPAVAGAGNPFLDLGTTVLPFPQAVIKKSSRLYTDNAPAGISTNDILEYTITIDNNSVVVLGNVIVLDAPPPSLLYVTNSSSRDAVAVADDAVPPSTTLFPFDEGGYVVPIIPRGSSTVLKYRARILASGSIANGASIGGNTVVTTNVVDVPPPAGATACILDFTDGAGTAVAAYAAGSGIYVTLVDIDANLDTNAVDTVSVVVRNAANGDLENLLLTELSANTNVFRNVSALPSSTTAGVAEQDGTLYVAAGQTLTVDYTDPVYGDSCNDSVVIATPSLIKPLYLSTDGSGSPDQDLDRVDPFATGDATTATSVVVTAGSAPLGVASTSTGGVSNASSLTFSHTPGSGTNRLLLVGIGVGGNGNNATAPNVTNVTYGGVALSQVVSNSSPAGAQTRSYIYSLTNPAAGPANVVVYLSGAGSVAVGATTYTNVNLTSPLGTPVLNSATVAGTVAMVTNTSAIGELVFAMASWDEGASNQSITNGAGQTSLWQFGGFDWATSAGSTKPGQGAVTNSFTAGDSQEWTIDAVAIKPAPLGTNRTTFVQTPTLCDTLSMPAGGTITITNRLLISSGSLATNPSITARLLNGASVFASNSAPVFTPATSNLVWTITLPTATNLSSGQAVTFEVTSAESAEVAILYDSSNRVSKIGLPVTTVIDITALDVYDAPYPGGSPVSVGNNGNTLYVRTTVRDPFGAYDITSLGLSIDASGTVSDVATTLTAGSVVASDTCSKTYEYVWSTGSTEGNYTIAVTANEGSEGITDTAATSINISYLDLGTPCDTAFTFGNNGPATNAFATNATVCVRVTDLDQNLDSAAVENLSAVLSSSSGDVEPLVLTETSTNSGVFTTCIAATNLAGFVGTNGVLSAPAGSVLTLNYEDPTDATDPCSATATVPMPIGTPGLLFTKTLVSPADGQAVVGEAVQFRLRAVNTGGTALNTIAVTDSYPVASLAYASATPAPSTTNTGTGTLTWTNVGPLAIGESADLYVNYLALASANQATNVAIANAGGGLVSTGTASVLITRPEVTVNKVVVSPVPGPANRGSNVVFQITLTNTGNTAISVLPLEDTYSGACFAFDSATPTPDSVAFGSLLWTNLASAGNLPAGGSVTVGVTLVASGGCDPAENFSPVSYAVDVYGDPVPPVTSTASLTTLAARITGTVYEDFDRDGAYSVGDAAFPGIVVRLYTDPDGDGDPADGVLVDLTTTLADGTYEFLNLGAGNYVVVETDQLSYVSTGDVAGANDNRVPVVIVALTTYAGNDFFDAQFPALDVQKTVSTTGSVPGEEWVQGTNGTPVLYSFVVSNPGSIALTNVVLSDTNIVPNLNTNVGTLVIGQSLTVTVAGAISGDLTNTVSVSGQYKGTGTVSAVDTAEVDRINPAIAISNTVGAGAFPGGELALGTNDAPVTYWFVVINSGDVTLTNVVVTNAALGFSADIGTLAPGQSVTTSVPGTITADLVNSAVATGFDPLGGGVTANDPSEVRLLPGAIGDFVWNDLDGDGVQDVGEPGISNVVVTLYDAATNAVGVTTTDVNGAYAFTNAAPGGVYFVGFAPPATYEFTPANQGGSDLLDSDADATTGYTAPTTLASGENDTTWDAGLYVPADIAGSVFVDVNGDGSFDAADTNGIGGVVVTLYDAASNVVGVATTGVDGAYAFADLPPGDYFVVEGDPSGFFSTGDTDGANDNLIDVTLVSGTDSTGNDFLDTEPGSIGDFVWDDLNGNGIQDGGEPGVPNATVNLYDAVSNLVDTTTTDASGAYVFTNVAPAAGYFVEFVPPAGYSIGLRDQGGNDAQDSDADAATGRSGPVEILTGEDDTSVDAALYVPADIAGSVFVDVDGDGAFDPADTNGIGSVVVTLYDAASNVVGVATTGVDGAYAFPGLPPGDYFIVEGDPSGFFSTGDTDGANDNRIDVTLVSGTDSSGNDYLDTEPGSIGDFVWDDQDGDGIQDGGEPGVPNATMNLYDAASNLVDTTTTDASGAYVFTNVAPAAGYFVEFVAPAGYVLGLPNLGGDDALDSDADAATGRSGPIEILTGADDTSVDAALYVPASLGSAVWEDLNGDGIQDAGEPGLQSVVVRLYDADTNLVDTTTTDAGGQYSFANLPPGEYFVAFSRPSGYRFTLQDRGGDDTVDSDADPVSGIAIPTMLVSGENDPTWNAGLYRPVSVGDYVWLDENWDGIQDPGEAGIPNVRMELLDGGLNVIAATLTDLNGLYLFAGLPPGDYTVRVDAATLAPQLAANPTFDPDGTLDGETAVTAVSGDVLLDGDFGFNWNPESDPDLSPGSIGDRI